MDEQPGDSGISDRVKNASPVGRDLVARLARAGIEAQLFGAPVRKIAVGRYEVVGELGTGGMGVVYRARDPELDRDVAIKLLRPSGSQHDPSTARSRLVREARAMARLTHPNVATVHEVGEFEDQVYVAMEYVEGRTLTQWLDQTQRDWREIVEMYVQAGRGLAGAHDKGVVHRDFKPDNVMVSSDGRVLVLDFGLARSNSDAEEQSRPVEVDEDDPSLTLTGALVGTPAYMSPELYAGEPADARSDQFAFAVGLWEAVYRQRPFHGDSLASLAQAVMDGSIREPIGAGPRPAWLRRVLERALSVSADDRYPTLHAMLADLEAGLAPKWHERWMPAAIGGLAFAVGLGLMLAARGDDERPSEVVRVPVAEDASDDPPVPKAAVVVSPAELPVPPPPEEPPVTAPAIATDIAAAVRPEAKPRKPKFTHRWCYYEEDGYRQVRGPTAKLTTSVASNGRCFSCYAGNADTLRDRVGNADCRDYALCYATACESG